MNSRVPSLNMSILCMNGYKSSKHMTQKDSVSMLCAKARE